MQMTKISLPAASKSFHETRTQKLSGSAAIGITQCENMIKAYSIGSTQEYLNAE